MYCMYFGEDFVQDQVHTRSSPYKVKFILGQVHTRAINTSYDKGYWFNKKKHYNSNAS